MINKKLKQARLLLNLGKWISEIWLVVFPALCYAQPVALTAIHFSPSAQATRMSFSLSAPTPSHVFTLTNPARLVIDLKQARLNTPLNSLNLLATGIRSVRSGHPDPSTLRIVCNMAEPIHFKVISSPQQSAVVVDMMAAKGSAVAEMPEPARIPLSKPAMMAASVTRPVIIVIDPGHGGKDPGAIGGYGAKEKNVTLAIARQLADLINQQPHMRAVLTRNGDYFVELRGRLKLARKGNADLFIALHADSYFNNQASGASVYALSAHGATSEAARWLARRDNYSELGGVDLRELGDQSYLLRSVLIDLAQTATITDSMRLGEIMLGSLSHLTRLHYPHVEQAPFMVLKSPDIPSILVEMGFISNEKEALRLQDKDYQNRIAEALLEGVRSYLKKYPITSA